MASQRQYDVALSRLGWRAVLAAKRRWAPGLPVREVWLVSRANGVMPQRREPVRSSTMPAPGNPPSILAPPCVQDKSDDEAAAVTMVRPALVAAAWESEAGTATASRMVSANDARSAAISTAGAGPLG